MREMAPIERFLVTPLLMFCFLCLQSCDWNTSQVEKDFTRAVRVLNRLIREYDKIPENQKLYGSESLIWKDEDQLKYFYQKYRKEFQSVDDILLTIVKVDNRNEWYDDAIFLRGNLYWLWTRVVREKQLVKKAIDVLNDYVVLPSEYHLEERTKTALQDTFWNKYKDLFSPDLTREENVRVLFRSSIAYLFVTIGEYQMAIKEYELIVKTYPTSRLSQQAENQVKGIKDILEGKRTIPSISPQK